MFKICGKDAFGVCNKFLAADQSALSTPIVGHWPYAKTIWHCQRACHIVLLASPRRKRGSCRCHTLSTCHGSFSGDSELWPFLVYRGDGRGTGLSKGYSLRSSASGLALRVLTRRLPVTYPRPLAGWIRVILALVQKLFQAGWTFDPELAIEGWQLGSLCGHPTDRGDDRWGRDQPRSAKLCLTCLLTCTGLAVSSATRFYAEPTRPDLSLQPRSIQSHCPMKGPYYYLSPNSPCSPALNSHL